MVSIEQARRGVARYLDDEILPKVTGIRRWVAGAACTAYLQRAEEIVERLRNVPAVSVLGVIDDMGMIDDDMIYNAFIEQARKGSASLEVPMIGAFTLSAGDIEKLHRYIHEA